MPNGPDQDGLLPEVTVVRRGRETQARNVKNLSDALRARIGQIATVEGKPASLIFLAGADSKNQGRVYTPASGEEPICVRDVLVTGVHEPDAMGVTNDPMLVVEFSETAQQANAERGVYYVGYRFPFSALDKVIVRDPAEGGA